MIAAPRPSTPLGVAVLGSQHRFTFFGSSARCYVCFERAPHLKSHLMDWLSSPCRVDPAMAHAFFDGRVRPARLPRHRPIVVGKRSAHATHDLYTLRGLVYCNQCGNYGHSRYLNLYKACTGMTDSHAIRSVRDLRRGNLPRGVSHWPNDARGDFDLTG